MITLALAVLLIIAIWLIVFGVYMLADRLIKVSLNIKQDSWLMMVHCFMVSLGCALCYLVINTLEKL